MTPAFLLLVTVFAVWPGFVSPCGGGQKPEPPKEPKKDCYCGLANRGPTSKIAGGKETGINEYPWQVLVLVRKRPCGGSLISEQWVLTAAHCVDAGVMKSDVEVSLGEHDYTSSVETKSILMDVAKIIIHGEYVPESFYDFALLKLKNEIDFILHPHIRPICLPADGSKKDYGGYVATATGWGSTSIDGPPTPQLQEVDMKVSTPNECRQSWIRRYLQNFDPILCAKGVVDGTGTCQGDSGGPLVTKERGHRGTVPGENYELIGVYSFGNNVSCVELLKGFGRVTAIVDWIKEKTKDSKTCPRT